MLALDALAPAPTCLFVLLTVPDKFFAAMKELDCF